MARTKMDAGLCVAAYVDDGMGRRLVIAPKTDGFNKTVIVATTQVEAKATIAVLRQLAEELPLGLRTVHRANPDGRGYVTEPDGTTHEETDAEFREYLLARARAAP